MQFNESTNNSGICQEIDFLCDSNTLSYPLKDKARRVNAAQNEILGELINADGTWQYDDTNYTDEPIGTINLTNNVAKYTFTDELLQIESVKIKGTDGVFHMLKAFDERDLGGATTEEVYGTTAGMPEYYDKLGDTIKLYPTPSSDYVTLTAGLKVHFKRKSSDFVSTDTTKEPGFASIYHVILAYMASIPYCMSYKKDRVALYEKKKDELMKALIKHYSRREKDRKNVIAPAPIAFR